VRLVRPGLHWLLWQASEDDRIPRESTEAWTRAIRKASFPVQYREVPYSTHLGGYFDDIEAELHQRVATRQAGQSGRDRRRPASVGARIP